jgi:hypothetical protein
MQSSRRRTPVWWRGCTLASPSGALTRREVRFCDCERLLWEARMSLEGRNPPSAPSTRAWAAKILLFRCTCDRVQQRARS